MDKARTAAGREPGVELVRATASAAFARGAGGPAGRAAPEAGTVTLVGAGPGDPELLTLRAVRALMGAGVVVYDHLVNEDILDLAPAGAELIYAGKQSGCHSLSQEEISKLLVALARRGERVVRLKGGDPFIFGRGGEEVEFLFRHGVAFEVVPGVTAASGAASYAGIPLTHRDHAQSCVFVTGHAKADGAGLDWPGLARARQTLVIYMGLAQAGAISAGLVGNGMDPATPAALIERATTPQQRVIATTVGELAATARRERVVSPALIIIGSVVTLHAALGATRHRVHPAAGESVAVPLS